ncbi:MAG TPA: TIGR03435 family protein [Gemmatimonadaceae bacterium]
MLLIVAILCALTLTGAAQQARPRFEVASIRPVSPSATFRGSPLNIRPDTFSATNHSVLQLIRVAYGVLERQVLDGPGWIRTERFSVTAKTSTDVPRDQALRMLQTLLADRFKLRVRQETREMPIIELRLARSDGRVGPNLYDCSKPQDGPQEKSFAAPTGGSVVSSDCRAGLSYAVDLASRELDAIVVDKTGLTGQWWFNIFFTEAIGPVDAPGNTPTFIGALTEQLGLKTERTRALTPVLVIESVERPTPN